MTGRRGRTRLAKRIVTVALIAIGAASIDTAVADTSCRGGQSFSGWLAAFRDDAAAAGIPAAVLSALDSVRLDERILRQDRGQPTLSQSFLDYAGRVVSAQRLSRGRALLDKYSSTLARVERDYGVPAPVVVAFWGLETDYGGFMGNAPLLTSLATLAYDCRRPEAFRSELIDALRILQHGDLHLSEMKGSWAGAVGHMQFTPSTYLKFAVDYDGDGRRDLVGSVPDALASAGRFIKSLGWRRGEPWLEEVRVADTVPWWESARAIQHPRSMWVAFGVSRVDGSALPSDDVKAALILPMGRLGPAFLAYENFGVFWEWNNSSNYSLAAAYLATRLAGAPRMQRGNAPPILSAEEMREVQQRLNAMGLDAGTPDGRLGEITRAAVKRAQLQLGLPTDGYPTRELLQRLRRQ
jgi:lytic murein transglycosylase